MLADPMSSVQISNKPKSDIRDLIKAYGHFCAQKAHFMGDDVPLPHETISLFDSGLSHLEAALAEPRAPTIDVWDDHDLEGIGVKSIGAPPHITRKPGCEAAVAQATALASSDLWSSDKFIRQLDLVTNTSCVENETLVHGWVDCFFQRVMAMLPQDKQLLLHMETQLLPKIEDQCYSGSGFMYYTVMCSQNYSDVKDLRRYYEQEELKWRVLYHHQPHNVILVTAALSKRIWTCVSQAVYKMYTFAVTTKKKIVRGALTSGDKWIFLILSMNDDFSGGTFRQSETITINCKLNYPHSGPVITDDFNPHHITAILMNWVQNSFSDLDDNDLLLQKIK